MISSKITSDRTISVRMYLLKNKERKGNETQQIKIKRDDKSRNMSDQIENNEFFMKNLKYITGHIFTFWKDFVCRTKF